MNARFHVCTHMKSYIIKSINFLMRYLSFCLHVNSWTSAYFLYRRFQKHCVKSYECTKMYICTVCTEALSKDLRSKLAITMWHSASHTPPPVLFHACDILCIHECVYYTHHSHKLDIWLLWLQWRRRGTHCEYLCVCEWRGADGYCLRQLRYCS